MSTKIKFLGDGDPQHKGEIHFTGVVGGDYTLCGITLDSDPMTFGSYKITKEKINCTNCQEIVTYCKSIRKTW
jgi:hypothetical protein